MRIYLDAAPVIYTVEDSERYSERVRRRLRQNGAQLVASDLTRLECRVQPIRDGNRVLLAAFDFFFETRVVEILPLSSALMDMATEVRATYGFQTPDAIHLAAAVSAQCDVFFTNDHRLDRFDRIVIEVVER